MYGSYNWFISLDGGFWLNIFLIIFKFFLIIDIIFISFFRFYNILVFFFRIRGCFGFWFIFLLFRVVGIMVFFVFWMSFLFWVLLSLVV